MRRTTRQLVGLVEQLNKAIEVKEDLFFKERPWLSAMGNIEPEIVSLDDEDIQRRMEANFAIELIIKKIKRMHVKIG